MVLRITKLIAHYDQEEELDPRSHNIGEKLEAVRFDPWNGGIGLVPWIKIEISIPLKEIVIMNDYQLLT